MGCCDAPGLMPIEEALDKLLSPIKPIQTTLSLPLAEALGYVLAEDILSPIFVPPFDNSAMDGYALRLANLENGNVLPLAGKSFAGQPFEGEWPSNTCIRIMTGAKIPEGCDAVIMQENTAETEAGIEIQQDNIKLNNNIRPTGDDIKQGDIVLSRGERLTPRDIPMIASLGVSHVTVLHKPKVAFFSTGDELKPLGQPLEDGQIYDSNRYGIKPLIEAFGCEAIDLGIIPDCPATLKETFEKAQQIADVVVTSGGVSVGEADYTKDILEELGQIGFWKLAIKPGKPFAFGELDNAWFCGLPGNPVSAMPAPPSPPPPAPSCRRASTASQTRGRRGSGAASQGHARLCPDRTLLEGCVGRVVRLGGGRDGGSQARARACGPRAPPLATGHSRAAAERADIFLVPMRKKGAERHGAGAARDARWRLTTTRP